MSTLAIMLKKEGCNVRGSDERKGASIKLLHQEKIVVDMKMNKREIRHADVIVFSSAIKQDNKQFVYAKKLKKKMLTRGQLLGQIAAGYEKVIAVAGSHGKTTTTAMIYEILRQNGDNPTLHLGGFRIEDGKNYELGDRKFFVTEACEYCDNFLNLYPQISVVTNIEKEHMDFFKTFERQLASFETFKRQSRFVIDGFDGVLVKKIRHDKDGSLLFKLYDKEKPIFSLHMKLCEEVNTQNVIYAYLVAKKLGISSAVIKVALEGFEGVKTRFEKMNCKDFDNVIFDYAHHPTEIAKAIQTAKKIYKGKNLLVIFQPHTFSRTKTLFKDFVTLFRKTQNVVLFKTYSAREKPREGVSAKELADALKQMGQNIFYCDSYRDLKNVLSKFDRETVLLFVGAGDLQSILHKNRFVT